MTTFQNLDPAQEPWKACAIAPGHPLDIDELIARWERYCQEHKNDPLQPWVEFMSPAEYEARKAAK